MLFSNSNFQNLKKEQTDIETNSTLLKLKSLEYLISSQTKIQTSMILSVQLKETFQI